jgi:hypothetical protein
LCPTGAETILIYHLKTEILHKNELPPHWYKPSICIVIKYFLTYLLVGYIGLTSYRMGTKVKPDISSVEVHPQLSHIGHLVDGALVGASSLSLLLSRGSGCEYIVSIGGVIAAVQG